MDPVEDALSEYAWNAENTEASEEDCDKQSEYAFNVKNTENTDEDKESVYAFDLKNSEASDVDKAKRTDDFVNDWHKWYAHTFVSSSVEEIEEAVSHLDAAAAFRDGAMMMSQQLKSLPRAGFVVRFHVLPAFLCDVGLVSGIILALFS